MGYYYSHDYDADYYSRLNSYDDCLTVRRLIKTIYRGVLSLTKATDFHQEKLYKDFESFCDVAENSNFYYDKTNIEKRRKELSFLHLKKHMETELTKDQVLQLLDTYILGADKEFKKLIYKNLKNFSDGKIQIKELLMSLHEEYKEVCFRQALYENSTNYGSDKKAILDFHAKSLQKINKTSLSKIELEDRISYLSSLSADIFSIMSYQQKEYLKDDFSCRAYYLGRQEKNKYEEVCYFVLSYDQNKITEILKRYNVSSFDELCEKYDKLRIQYQKAIKLSKDNIEIRIHPTLGIGSNEILNLYDSGFFSFPPSTSEMKKLINDRIVYCASRPQDETPNDVFYEKKLLEFYKKGCKELSESQIVTLYDRIIETSKCCQYVNTSHLEDDERIRKIEKEYEEELKCFQKVFVKIILERRKIVNPTESDYIEIIKDVLKDSYDYINERYVSDAVYVDSESYDKNKKNNM